MFLNQEFVLKKKNVLLVTADNISGAMAFSELDKYIKELCPDKQMTEEDLKNLWKLYFLQIITDKLVDDMSEDNNLQKVINILVENGLSSQNKNLSGEEKLRKVVEFMSNIKELDVTKGLKISFHEKGDIQSSISINHLFSLIEKYLMSSNYKIVITIDRLDAAFPANSKLEKSVLKSLLRVFLDLKCYSTLGLMIFLRSDMWKVITEHGFRELTHIEYEEIQWNKDNLYSLFMKRLVDNKVLLKTYKIRKNSLLKSVELQNILFSKLFPEKVNPGKRESKTFDWMMSRLEDGTGNVQPRDLIYFVQLLIKLSIEKIDSNQLTNDLNSDAIFTKDIFQKSLEEVSNSRLTRNLYSEYPKLKKYIESFENKKAEHTLESLSQLWSISIEKTEDISSSLISIGFLRKSKSRFAVPYLYRSGILNIKNGKQSIV